MMEQISKQEFNQAKIEEEKESKKNKKDSPELDMKALLEEMENPLLAQKKIAIQIKVFLEKRMKEEMKGKGLLSENTRRWIESYNNILEKIQKGLHGDKSVNLHLHRVSHSDIATKIRESIQDEQYN